ncbi:MAG TPA: hypothetical protein VLB46_05470 [Pyrinomonadaceae bacterium]|nr:hypothetical protein [Pyrinomonadaceae bacterium]
MDITHHRSFSEVLNSFMEESNIRWGEIIGGLLIIGCSTALVVSLWAQISEIPVLKFLIFTTVTAVLFGIGLYTEYRWKLPTTSRGILTIATLLVPLNFLAIAAVSAGNTSGALVIGSELAAPAIFLCLVYFAGRVITPGCAHILSAGVLGSSAGQLLVRHFASLDAGPWLLIFLGAFPVVCYVVTVGLALRVVLHDRQIDESDTTTVFTALGTMSFAALLPFGLLLYKSGPVWMSMMYLAPLATLWGVPMLATGTILWRKIANKEMVAARTAGTALGILGLMIVLAGMILAWPNPASIVPAALLNFVILTVLAVALELPVAHVIAALCFALAYVVTFHVFSGNITWENLRVMSLLEVSVSVRSGQALAGAVALFVLASEWLKKTSELKNRTSQEEGLAPASYYYIVAASITAVVSLMLVTGLGISALDQYSIWIVYGLYALGAFWIAWRRRVVQFAWAGSALLLVALALNFAPAGIAFPWQTAFFAHATICAAAAIVCSRYERCKLLSAPLNYSALISIVLGVVCLFQANTWTITWMQAQRVFWIAGILLLLLWLNRRRLILNLFQVALISGLVLTVKAALQQYEWYSYLPHAFLHPAALQIQGTVLALFCLAWLALRLLVRRGGPLWPRLSGITQGRPEKAAATALLDGGYTVDRFVLWALLPAFLLLAVYGALSGVTQELAGFASLDVAGFPHQEALGLGSWILLGLLLVAMLLSFRERRHNAYLLGAVTVFAAAIPLLAGRFENQLATATAWRWLAAVFLLLGSIAIWSRRTAVREGFIEEARTLLFILTIVPLLILTSYPALRAVFYLPVLGPVSGFFSLFDDDFVYGVPLVLTALVLIGYAVRERMPSFALYAGAFFNLTVTLAFLLAVVSGHGLMDRTVLIHLVQLNAITLAVYLLPWLSTRRRWQPALDQGGQRVADSLLKLQLWLAISLSAALLLSVLFMLVLFPNEVGAGTIAAGSSLGWLSLLSITVATIWLAVTRPIRLSAWMLAGFLFVVSSLIAFDFAAISGWAGLHLLTVCIAGTAWLMFATAELTRDKWQTTSRNVSAVIGSIAVYLSLRSLLDGGGFPAWWSIAPLLAIVALAVALNLRTKARAYLYTAGVLFGISTSLWWLLIGQESFRVSEFLLVNLVANSLAGVIWLLLDLRSRQRESSAGYYFSFHNVAAMLSLDVLASLVVLSFVFDTPQLSLLNTPRLTWLAFASVVTLMTACLWDRYGKCAVAGLYTLGLLGCGIALQQPALSSERFAWSATIVLAVYSLCAALVWHWRARLFVLAQRLRIPKRIGADVSELPWLASFSIVAVTTVAALACWMNLTFVDFDLRATAALAFAAQFLTFGLLAEGAQAQRWRRAAIVVFVMGVVFFGWSWLTPGVNATWLNRSVILMLVVFVLTALYALLLDKANKHFAQWTKAARSCVAWLLGAGVMALFFCLGTEVRYQLDFGAVLVHPLALVAIGITLLASVVICVLFALSKDHDPLSLSERSRTGYIYAAEVMLALLFLHVRLTMPWLFTGFIEHYWPLVVMSIAFFGVITSEALRRAQVLVLAKPLERTGAFLPLLPVLGFWIASSEVDFSVLLFIVGGLYGLLSILRRSFGFGVLAAVAGNAGLWYAFQRTAGYGFLQHPQLWLVPAALSVLAAAYLNEDKLSEEQMTGIRYLSLITIYVSSTADIFINGVANSPWLPLILGSFSLAGIFAGIVFRIRGMTLLGSIFLLLSIVTMIWYASENFGWTWLWYVFGIVTGAAILLTFGVFEKRRHKTADLRG